MTIKSRAYADSFSELFEERVRSTNSIIEKLKNKEIPDNFIGRYYEMASLGFSTIAIGEYIVNKDIVKCKQYFYLASKIQEILFIKYDRQLLKIDPALVTMNKFPRLLMALISDSSDLTNSLANLFGGRLKEEDKHGTPFTTNVGYAMKYLLQKNNDEAWKHVNALIDMGEQKNMKPYAGYGLVLKGILERNSVGVNEGLEYMLECHNQIKEYKDTPEEIFSVPVLGLAKLAMCTGIDININNALAPEEVLQKHTIEYPAIDFADYDL